MVAKMATQNQNITTENANSARGQAVRFTVIAALVLMAFFVSYRFAVADNASASADLAATAVTNPTGSYGAAGADAGAGCACCGTGGSSEPVEGAAAVDADGVQRITVDTSTGGYNPNVIKLQAGVPAEITFGQAGGCLAQVMSADLGFYEDLQAGPRTIALPALSAGTYGFSCGMEMVFGQIVVE